MENTFSVLPHKYDLNNSLFPDHSTKFFWAVECVLDCFHSLPWSERDKSGFDENKDVIIEILSQMFVEHLVSD